MVTALSLRALDGIAPANCGNIGNGPARRYERRTDGLTTSAFEVPAWLQRTIHRARFRFARRVITRATGACDAADQLLAALDDGRVLVFDDDRRCLTMWFIEHAIREASCEFAVQDAAEEAARHEEQSGDARWL